LGGLDDSAPQEEAHDSPVLVDGLTEKAQKGGAGSVAAKVMAARTHRRVRLSGKQPTHEAPHAEGVDYCLLQPPPQEQRYLKSPKPGHELLALDYDGSVESKSVKLHVPPPE